jgi:hypothetical protein
MALPVKQAPVRENPPNLCVTFDIPAAEHGSCSGKLAALTPPNQPPSQAQHALLASPRPVSTDTTQRRPDHPSRHGSAEERAVTHNHPGLRQRGGAHLAPAPPPTACWARHT